jgi:hypothetical protein
VSVLGHLPHVSDGARPYGKKSKLFLVHVGPSHLDPARAHERGILLPYTCDHGMIRAKFFYGGQRYVIIPEFIGVWQSRFVTVWREGDRMVMEKR